MKHNEQTQIIHQHVPQNNLGEDYFVGDIHGKYELLKVELEKRNFNPVSDRLFSVGDIINRGEESEKLLRLLDESWFFAVQGNHEQMLLNCLEDNDRLAHFYSIGGMWLKKYLASSQSADRIRRKILSMPLAITVETAIGKIGVSHADAPTDWNLIKTKKITQEDISIMQWRRVGDVVSRQSIESIKVCIHGHSAVAKAKVINNQIWIDTYFESGNLTLLSTDDINNLSRPKRRLFSLT